MRINVKTLDSRNHPFDVESQLKEIISNDVSMSVDRIRLIFGGNILNDGDTVSQIGLADGATLHCVDRTPPRIGNKILKIDPLPEDATAIPTTSQRPTTEGQINPVGTRLMTCNRFMNHIESILSRYYSDGGPLNRYIFQPVRQPQVDLVTDQNPFLATINTVHRFSGFLDEFRRFLDAYLNFLTRASNNDMSTLIDDGLYPQFNDDMANTMHSMSHVFHNLSDIMVNRVSETSGDEFRLIVPHLSRGSRWSTFMRPPGTAQTNLGQESGTEREPRPTNQQNVSSQGETTGDLPMPPASDQELRDGMAYHLTVQFTTDITPYQDSPDIVIFQDSQRSAPDTAYILPNLIRTTAGAAGSAGQSGSSGNAPSSTSIPTDGIGAETVGSGGNNSNIPPHDSHLNCNSFFCNTGVSQNYQIFPDRERRREPPQQGERRSSRHGSSRSQPATSFEPTIIIQPQNSPFRVVEQNISQASPRPRTNEIPIEDQSLDDGNWRRIFPESFVPIIENDVSHQKNARRSQSYSDGYIACSPLKRKRMEDQEEATNFLMSSLSDAFVSSLATNDSTSVDVEGLRTALSNDHVLSQQYRQSIEMDLSTKLAAHDDFCSENYPQCYDLKRKYQ